MTNAIAINHRKQAIEITKAFQKKASIFNSYVYKMLKEVKNDFPTFRIKSNREASAATCGCKDLTISRLCSNI